MSSRTYVPAHPIWCAGCGHFGVENALRRALSELAIPDHQVIILAGIGCSGTVQNNMGTYGYHALHGRVLPTATGVTLANPSLTVVAAGGDGDGYAIGAGHLLHAFRRNLPMVYIVMNNQTYGLTKGQRSPTRDASAGIGAEAPFDALTLGLSSGATFLARGYSGQFEQLVHLTVQALEHARSRSGFGFLEVISPCVTYWDTYPTWDAALHDVGKDPNYDSADRAAAFALSVALADEGRLPMGLVYRDPDASRTGSHGLNPAEADLDPAKLVDRFRSISDTYAATFNQRH
jgi:2-oxoglutarate ferredoxin oxidoreductase subunit beta